MAKQRIIAISREYGSGGHYIAKLLAERHGLPLYDHALLDEIAEEKGIDLSKMRKYDEGFQKPFIHRTVRGMSNSPEEALAEMQFKFLQEKAEEGLSFVVVGRCAETVLDDYPCVMSVFITGDIEARISRVKNIRDMSDDEARKTLARHDKERRAYHNHYCNMKWGDPNLYDICINSSRLGLVGTADLLEDYMKYRY